MYIYIFEQNEININMLKGNTKLTKVPIYNIYVIHSVLPRPKLHK